MTQMSGNGRVASEPGVSVSRWCSWPRLRCSCQVTVFSAASGDAFVVELRGLARVSQEFLIRTLRMAADLGAAAKFTVLKKAYF